MIFYVTTFFVSIAIIERLIINPIFSKIESLNKEILDRESSIKRNLRILAYKETIVSESKKYGDYLKKFNSEQEAITFLLKEVENLANESSIYLVDMQPRGVEKIDSAMKYNIRLTGEAQMEQLIDFMYNIEKSEGLLMITEYDISPKTRDSSIAKCSMSISKLAIIE